MSAMTTLPPGARVCINDTAPAPFIGRTGIVVAASETTLAGLDLCAEIDGQRVLLFRCEVEVEAS